MAFHRESAVKENPMTLFLTCPVCGRRNGYEFLYGGEDKGPRPAGENRGAGDWCDYVHNSSNAAGIVREWWVHRFGCGTWFTVWRDTRNNRQVPAAQSPDEKGAAP
jgi:sarcosine oxidase subunit delta